MTKSDSIQTDETVARLRQRGQAALADLFGQNRDRLRRMVDIRLDCRVAGRVDPSDVLQEAFLDASQQLESYLSGLPMPPFLWLRFLTGQRLMATHRHHLGAQKRDAKREVSLQGLERPEVRSASLSSYLVGRLTSPSDAATRLEMQARLQELLDSLEPLDREILSLRHFEELSNNEAAAELRITKAAASQRYIRAMERLRKAVADAPGLLNSE